MERDDLKEEIEEPDVLNPSGRLMSEGGELSEWQTANAATAQSPIFLGALYL